LTGEVIDVEELEPKELLGGERIGS
jgi:hypothetical protein